MKLGYAVLISMILGCGAAQGAPDATPELAHVIDNPHQRIIEVTHTNFQDLMHFSKPVIIEVYSEHCIYCKRLFPILDELNKEQTGNLQFAKLSFDDNPDLVDSFNVQGFPTILFIQGGKEVGRHVGFMNKDAFKAEINRYFPNK